MSVVVDELEVVPAEPPPGEPAPRAAPDLPRQSVPEQVEKLVRVREERAARLRAD